MRLIEDVRQAASSANVYCTNCGAVNPVGQVECSECENPLEVPTTMVGNILGVLAWPQRGLRKVVATAPIIQALLVVIAATSLVLIAQTVSVLIQLQSAFTGLPKLQSELNSEIYFLRALRTPLTNLGYSNVPQTNISDFLGASPSPDITTILISFIQGIVTWFLFAGVIYLLARLLYKREAIRNFKGLLALVGFARVTWVAFLLIFPLLGVSDLADVSQILVLLLAIWQLALIVTGVKQGLKLTWNHALTVVLLPAVIVVLVFGLLQLILFA